VDSERLNEENVIRAKFRRRMAWVKGSEMMKLTIALIVVSLPATAVHAEIYNYSCKVNGKTYPLRVDDNKNVLEWRSKKYSLTIASADEPDGCAKYGWHAKGYGTSFTFCTATKGYAAIEDKDGNEQVQCNLAAKTVTSQKTTLPVREGLPAGFMGIWMFADESSKICVAANWKGVGANDDDRLINVTERSIMESESGCDFNSIKRVSDTTVNISMSCSGEGETWKADELWQLQDIVGQRLLIRTDGKRSSVRIFRKCQ
jgi:hypothetical protein